MASLWVGCTRLVSLQKCSWIYFLMIACVSSNSLRLGVLITPSPLRPGTPLEGRMKGGSLSRPLSIDRRLLGSGPSLAEFEPGSII